MLTQFSIPNLGNADLARTNSNLQTYKKTTKQYFALFLQSVIILLEGVLQGSIPF